jgi:uncharacterized protein (UPF0335 family)
MSDCAGGAGAGERVEDEVAGVGGEIKDVFQKSLRLRCIKYGVVVEGFDFK